MTGIINLYKEKGMTSHTCVAKVRKILNIKKTGHPGTLDPEATGVLPIMVGGATRCSDLFLDMRKVYRAEATLGLKSDTQDIWGNVEKTAANASKITSEEVEKVLGGFKGTVLQVPPAYSALKKDGVPYYKLARRGEEVHAEARPVSIYSCELISFKTGEDGLPVAEIEVCCGRGTYIRTIINDLGESLGCGAVMSKLERTSYGNFHAVNAVTLEKLEAAAQGGNLQGIVRPIRDLFDFPRLELTSKEQTFYMQGRTVTADSGRIEFPENCENSDIANVRILLFFEGREFALSTAVPDGAGRCALKPERYFGTD